MKTTCIVGKKFKFKSSDFSDIWDHMLAAPMSSALVKKVVDRANKLLSDSSKKKVKLIK